jgi:hypothetical protein
MLDLNDEFSVGPGGKLNEYRINSIQYSDTTSEWEAQSLDYKSMKKILQT